MKFLQLNPNNSAGEMSFLRGVTYDRLIVIGRGLDYPGIMDSRYTDTQLWTYDVLLQEARRRWSGTLQLQRKVAGLPELELSL